MPLVNSRETTSLKIQIRLFVILFYFDKEPVVVAHDNSFLFANIRTELYGHDYGGQVDCTILFD